mgnify:CR=1 FL=1
MLPDKNGNHECMRCGNKFLVSSALFKGYYCPNCTE